ncbi:MAG: calcium-binding protein, partial [Pirellula sp.]
MQLMTGGSATLFSLELPLLSAKFEFDVPVATFAIYGVPVIISAVGRASLSLDLAFGYDTFGVQKMLKTGNPTDLLDGFFLYDVTLPEYRMSGGLPRKVPGSGGVDKDELQFALDIGLRGGIGTSAISVGLGGGVYVTSGLDLQDIATSKLVKDGDGRVTSVVWQSDGKIRGSEIATMWSYSQEPGGTPGGPLNLFNFNVKAEVFAEVYGKFPSVGTLRAELSRLKLLDLSFPAPNVKPYLAQKVGSTLFINAGPRASNRAYFNTQDGNEAFILSSGSNPGSVNVEFEDWYSSYEGITNVVANMGDGDDTFDASRLVGITVDVDGGAGNDKLYTGKAGGTLRGGFGDDTLNGNDGTDSLFGDAGDDRINGMGGNDMLEGGPDNDSLNGGAGDDTFRFGDAFGEDRFADGKDGIAIFDFSPAMNGISAALSSRGLEVSQGREHNIRAARAKVSKLILGQGDDRLLVGDFPERWIHVIDPGGNDQYRIPMGNPGSTKATGTLQIQDDGGSFDEIVLEQTRKTPITLDTYQVNNGREVINYSASVERLTITGKSAAYNADGIIHFGGPVSYAKKPEQSAVDLKSTSLRIIADEVLFNEELKATSVIVESYKDLNVSNRINAANNGFIDLRVFKDNSKIVLKKDLLASAGDDWQGTGSGYIRLLAPDGSITRDGDVQIKGTMAHLIVKAFDHIGTVNNPLRTEVGSLTAATAVEGTGGDIYILEADDLTLTELDNHPLYNNGLVIPAFDSPPVWIEKNNWDNSASADWLDQVRDGNDIYAVVSGSGVVDLRLDAPGALLTLGSGRIESRAAGKSITLTADDFDFVSGENKILGPGELIIRSTHDELDYRLGSAGETAAGLDRSSLGRDTTVYLGVRDFAAIGDDFQVVRIGHRSINEDNIGNQMVLGDIYDRPDIKASSSPRSIHAALRNTTEFFADTISVQGDVQAPEDRVVLNAHRAEIKAKNLHVPLGLNDSGVSARDVSLVLDEQLLNSGWIIGKDKVDIKVLTTDGTRPIYRSSDGDLVSLLAEVGSRIESINPGSRIDVSTNKSIQIAGTLEVFGTDSSATISSSTMLTILEGGLVAGRNDHAVLTLKAGLLLSINPGAAVIAGVRFVDLDGTPVAQQTGTRADAILESAYELFIGGSVTTSDLMRLKSGPALQDHSDYFNNLGLVDADHPLIGHTRYGLLLMGTLTTLASDSLLNLESKADIIVRGNINVLGDRSDLLIRSDRFVYVEGTIDVKDTLRIIGGQDESGNAIENSTVPTAVGQGVVGSSLHVASTARLITRDAGSLIELRGAQDVDLYGAIVAGGSIGSSGVTFSGPSSSIIVSSEQQVFLDTGLLASGTITLNSGVPGPDDSLSALFPGKNLSEQDPDELLSLVITTAGGMTTEGWTTNFSGGGIVINSQGNVEILGNLNAGVKVTQRFDSEGKFLGENFTYTPEPAALTINASGRAFLGGRTLNQAGEIVKTGTYLRAAHAITVNGGSHSTLEGLLVHAASELTVNDPDGVITLSSAQNASIIGAFIAGGRIDTVRDAAGGYLGRNFVIFGGDSVVTIQAGGKVEIGQDIMAGKAINLIGGTGNGQGGPGLVIQGSGRLKTWQANSSINLNAPGEVHLMAPGQIYEIAADDFVATPTCTSASTS